MQLQKNLDQFKSAGIAVFAISYDPVQALAAFSDEFGIAFPLLSDRNHEAIEATGILNTLIKPEEEGIYGVAFPGSYVVGRDGAIEEKLFFRHYRVRPSAATVLRSGFGLDFEVRANPRAEAEGAGVRIKATLGGESMVFGETSTLYIDVELDEGLHLYGDPAPDGFSATWVTVTAPERVTVGDILYPPTTSFHVSGIDAEFRVFDGDVRMAVPLQSGLAEGDPFGLDISVSYQTCSDTVCHLPQTRELHLEVPVAPLNRPQSRT